MRDTLPEGFSHFVTSMVYTIGRSIVCENGIYDSLLLQSK